MNSQIVTARNLSFAAIGALTVVLWESQFYFAAMILLLVAAGVAMARPSIRDHRLMLDGTPVLLLFAVMFVAASGMVYAVEQVGALFERDTATECTADMQHAVRRVSIPELGI